jgi:crossover junction endodeoxyribonuclease RusA
MTIKLPWPPSVNHYWRHVRIGRAIRVHISQEGAAYRRDVRSICKVYRVPRVEGRLTVAVSVVAPDKRKRDLDNLLKGLLDALCHAGVYEDDSQIDQLTITRGKQATPGHVIVTVNQIRENLTP